MKNEKKTEVTIYDLAKKLLISPSTVSRALSGHQGIGRKTKANVKKLAKELGYRPNNFASSLRTKKSKTIGILVPWINRNFISTLIAGIENTARKNGYQIIISQSQDKTELEKENLQTLFNSRICALIVSLGMETSKYDHFDLFRDKKIPVIFVDRIPQLENVFKVKINNHQAAYEATEHLILQGCTRIAHFGGARCQSIYEERRLGYLNALQTHQLEIDSKLALEAQTLNSTEGTRMANQILDLSNPPDGLFCANDTSAVSAIQFAKKRGVRIPEDLAIIGFNNDPICKIIEPELSSIQHPAYEMGEVAVDQVLSLVNGKENNIDSSLTLSLETSVIARASSLRLK